MKKEMHKPKLILHIGHGKTGTTSVQDFFAKNNAGLLRLGYLYPVRHSPRNNHVILRAAFMEPESFNVHDYQVYSGNIEWFKEDSERFFKSLLEDVEKYRPHTVILSAEQMFRDFSEHSNIELADFLKLYFSDVLVVAYVKSPVSDYMSRLAQRIRTGVNELSPEHRPVMKVLKYYEGQFPGCIRVRPFEKSQLIGRDVLHDFIGCYIPNALKLIKGGSLSRSNVSLSWTVLLTLRKLRMRVQPEGKKPTLKTRMLLAKAAKELQKKDLKRQEIKPQLKAEVCDFLIKSAVDFRWLRKNYGIVFSDLDYSKIEPSYNDDKVEDMSEIEDILDISKVDCAKYDERWYQKSGVAYKVYLLLFNARMRFKRLVNLYFRNALSMRNKLK